MIEIVTSNSTFSIVSTRFDQKNLRSLLFRALIPPNYTHLLLKFSSVIFLEFCFCVTRNNTTSL